MALKYDRLVGNSVHNKLIESVDLLEATWKYHIYVSWHQQ